jgi:hypothetical protein
LHANCRTGSPRPCGWAGVDTQRMEPIQTTCQREARPAACCDHLMSNKAPPCMCILLTWAPHPWTCLCHGPGPTHVFKSCCTLGHVCHKLQLTSSPRCEKSFSSPLQMPHAFTVLVSRFPLPITLACSSNTCSVIGRVHCQQQQLHCSK